MGPDYYTLRLKVGPNPGVDSRHLKIEGDDREGSQDLFNEGFSATAAHGAVRSVDSVKELRGGYCGEGHGFVAQLLQEIRQISS